MKDTRCDAAGPRKTAAVSASDAVGERYSGVASGGAVGKAEDPVAGGGDDAA
jgi:hypothetical protein